MQRLIKSIKRFLLTFMCLSLLTVLCWWILFAHDEGQMTSGLLANTCKSFVTIVTFPVVKLMNDPENNWENAQKVFWWSMILDSIFISLILAILDKNDARTGDANIRNVKED